MHLIYIHGFASSANAAKALQVEKFFPQYSTIRPNLPVSPTQAIATLEEIISPLLNEKIVLFGSSLGGFYATFLAEKYSLKAVLINPVVDAYKILAPAVGVPLHNFQTNDNFIFDSTSHLQLQNLNPSSPSNGKYLLMLQKNDQTLDFHHALNFYLPHHCDIIIRSHGGHQYSQFELDLPMVSNFIHQP
ncbi:MAG: YqiA/YcfP family alpha/beta fold hydrolase [Lentisphaeria bacterium]